VPRFALRDAADGFCLVMSSTFSPARRGLLWLGAGAVAAVAVVGVASLQMGGYPGVAWHAAREREAGVDGSAVITVGALRLVVPNRFQFFPFRADLPPAELLAASLRAEPVPATADLTAAAQHVALTFDLPDYAPGTLRQDRRVVADLQYRPAVGVAALTVAAAQDGTGWRDGATRLVRAPAEDTPAYAAFRVEEATARAVKPVPREPVGTRVYVSRKGAAPLVVACHAVEHVTWHDEECDFVAPFLADRFPAGADGKYPYVLSVSVPPGKVDEAGTIGREVAARVAGYIQK
jgi:hypothetical protein